MGPTMTGSYDPGLVLFSYLIAVVASFTALALARHLAQGDVGARWRWLTAGACSMGLGIWAMHFVGMLAFDVGMPLAYDVPLTVASMGVGALASGFALFIGSRAHISAGRLAASGLVMGLGIAAMHYTGMAAMRMDAAVPTTPPSSPPPSSWPSARRRRPSGSRSGCPRATTATSGTWPGPRS